jgi:hypothetical protein
VAAGSGDWPGTAGSGEKPRTNAFDSSVAHPARVWDYWLGGKNHYAADRAAGDHVLQAAPVVREVARADRAFLASAVHHLVANLGIRQFLDIGTGLPAAGNTHEVAYVDNDPVVLAHARALLISDPEGATAYIDADARDTGKILAQAAQTLDFTRPAAVMLLGILLFIPDADDPWAVTAELMDAVPAGSYLAVSHGASDIRAGQVATAGSRYNEHSAVPMRLRTREEFTRFLDGLELAVPGVVPVNHWHPGPPPGTRKKAALPAYAALGRKPAQPRGRRGGIAG